MFEIIYISEMLKRYITHKLQGRPLEIFISFDKYNSPGSNIISMVGDRGVMYKAYMPNAGLYIPQSEDNGLYKALYEIRGHISFHIEEKDVFMLALDHALKTDIASFVFEYWSDNQSENEKNAGFRAETLFMSIKDVDLNTRYKVKLFHNLYKSNLTRHLMIMVPQYAALTSPLPLEDTS